MDSETTMISVVVPERRPIKVTRLADGRACAPLSPISVPPSSLSSGRRAEAEEGRAPAVPTINEGAEEREREREHSDERSERESRDLLAHDATTRATNSRETSGSLKTHWSGSSERKHERPIGQAAEASPTGRLGGQGQ